MRGASLSRRRVRALLLAAAAVTFPMPAMADTWDNSTNTGAWSNAQNWADNSEPVGAEPVTFPTPIPFGQQIVNLSAGEVAGAITFNANYTLSGIFGGTLQLTGGGGVIQTNNNSNCTISAPISGSFGLTHGGNGSLFLSAANTFTSTVVCGSQGGLRIGADSAFGNAANGIHFDNGKLEVLQTVTTSRPITMHFIWGGQLQVNAPHTFQVNSAFGGANAAPFKFSGSGTTILNAASSRSGTTTIQQNRVRTTNGAALGTGTVNVLDFGTLELGNITSSVPISLGLNGTVRSFNTATYSGTVTAVDGPATMNLTGGEFPTGTLTIANPTNGYAGGAAISGALPTTHITGIGTVILAGPNSYAGNWQVDSGTLRVQHPSGLGSGTSNVVVAAGATLDIAATTISRGVSLGSGARLSADTGSATTGPVVVDATGTVTIFPYGSGSFTLGDNPNDLTGGGPSSTINVTSSGNTGRLILTQPSNYLGTWNISQSASLWPSGDDQLGDVNNGIILDGLLRGLGNFGNDTRNITLTGNGFIDTNSFTATFGNVQGSGGLTKQNSGTLIVNHVRAGGTLTVSGGTMRILANGTPTGTSKVGSLAFVHQGPGSKLDLTNNKIIVADGLLGTPGSEGFYNGLTGEIQTGFNAGTWDGAGIITSMPDAQSGLTSLGIATADQTGYAGGTFGGVSVVATDLLIMYTYSGDANLDGKINIDDYGRIDGNVSQSGIVFGWFNGDFNYDGKINIDDYGIIDGNLNRQGAAFATSAALEGLASVPEPASLALLAAATLLPLRRRRGVSRG